jgi:hypothetical protein
LRILFVRVSIWTDEVSPASSAARSFASLAFWAALVMSIAMVCVSFVICGFGRLAA